MTSLSQKSSPSFAAARYNMVENQLRPNKIRDERVLEAMEKLPREIFVPDHLKGIAYIDQSLRVASGRYLIEPMIQARMAQEAQVKKDDHVLDIATGTGYSTVLWAALAKQVVGIETDVGLQAKAKENLATLGIKNAEIHATPLSQGWKAAAPYDVIMINGAVDSVSEVLFSQLAEGGRLLAVVRQYGPAHASHTARMVLYKKIAGVISGLPVFDANLELLPGFEVIKPFVF